MRPYNQQIQILDNLFENPTKVRLLRLFLRNSNRFFKSSEAAKIIRCNNGVVKRQIGKLLGIKFLRKKIAKVKKGKKIKKFEIFCIDPSFEFYDELKSLILKSTLISFNKMIQRFKSMGRAKLLLLSGLFLNFDNARADMLLVIDGLNKNKLSNFIKNLESEAGKELNYVIMSSKEFEYRHSMFDNFIRDLLENKNVKLIDKYNLD